MKILFLTSRFRPELGGVETHSFEVVQRFVRKGHSVRVISEESIGTQANSRSKKPSTNVVTFGDPMSGTKKEVNGISITRLNFGPSGFLKKFRIWMTLWKNRSLIEQADIIHCHDVFIWYFPFRFLYTRKKVFTTFHGYEGVYPPSKKSIFIRQLSNRLSRGSINIGHFIEKWYGTKADIVLYGAPVNSDLRLIR